MSVIVRNEVISPAVIKVKYHDPDMPDIRPAHDGEWIDLYTAERVVMCPGDFKMISLGVSIELPPGYEAIVAPRSSTFKHYGVLCANGIGIIDHAYKGDNDVWHFPAYCAKVPEKEILSVIPEHTRICQFRIQRQQPDCEIIRVDSLGNENRGGLGSTGRS